MLRIVSLKMSIFGVKRVSDEYFCTRTLDGAKVAWTAGIVIAVADGKYLFSVRVRLQRSSSTRGCQPLGGGLDS